MTTGSRATVAALGLILGWQLLVRPIVGLADQGDYARISGVFGLGPRTKDPVERFYGYVNRIYVPDPGFRTRELEVATSEYLFTGVAVGLSRLFSRDGVFDLRMLGAVHMAAFLAIAWWLLARCDALLPPACRWVARFALVFVYCDVAYIAYFNSFYSEPASYLFLMMLLAATLEFAARPDVRSALLWSGAALLLILAKSQNCVLGVVLAGCSAMLWRLVPGRAPAWRFAAPVVLLAASALLFLQAPGQLKRANAFNHLFMQILPLSHDPGGDLAWFGLSEEWLQFKNVGAYTPGSPFADPQKAPVVTARVTFGTIAEFYAAHPAAFWRLTRKMLRESASLRTNYGNYERDAGFPPGAHSRTWSYWSRLREWGIGNQERLPLFWLLLAIPVGAWKASRAAKPAHRVLAGAFTVLAIAALVSFYTAILGDGYDTEKHLYLYGLLLDTTVVCAMLHAAAFL